MAKKKDNETFDGQDISAIMNGDVFSSFMQAVNSTRNLLLTATPSPSYDTVSPENFATNDVEYVGFAKDGRNLVVTYYYDNDSLNTPSQSSVTIKDYFDNAEETLTVSKVKVSDFARKAFVNIADIAQSVSPEGDDWGDITQYLNGEEYSGQINYNETTGKLELTKFELSEGLVDNMTKSGEEYLAEGNNAIPLSLTPENYNSSVKINGTTYYFDTDDQRLQTLTRIGSSALVETGNEEDAVFSYGGKYYTYNPDKLPISACEYEEVTNETDILNRNYNSVRYKDGAIHYYDIVLNPSRMTSSSSVLWTETTKSEAIDDVTGKLKAGYLEIKMHKVNGTDDSRYMKYSLKSLSTPTSEDNQDVITSADKVTFPNTKLTNMIIGKPEGTNDLVMYYNGTQESIKLTDWFTTAAADRIQKIVDSTGTEYDIVHDTAYNKTIKYLTEEDDEYTQSSQNYIVLAFGGNDTLTVNASNNTIYGGKGDDSIVLNRFSYSKIYGDDGNDTIRVTGNQTNETSALFQGSKGDDLFNFYRAGYNHTFIFESGDGNDRISMSQCQANTYTLKFTDVKFEDLNIAPDTTSNANLKISYGNNDSIIINGWYAPWLYNNTQITKIVDCTGTEYNIKDENPDYNILYGTSDDDTIDIRGLYTYYGLDGNDTINLYYSSQSATIGGATIHGGNGDDSIILNDFSYSKIYGDDGNDTIRVTGNQTNETSALFQGGKGDDLFNFYRAGYNHTFIFESGDGNDRISMSQCQANTYTLKFTDLKFEDMEIGVDSTNTANLKIQYTANDSITLSNWYISDKIDKIVDMTGTQYSIVNDVPDYKKLYGTNEADTITAKGGIEVYALAGDDTINCSGSGNVIYAGDGNDTIICQNNANSSSNIIFAGKGNDIFDFYRAGNNHTFTFESGDGNDRISTNQCNDNTYTLKFTDLKFEDMKIGVDSTNTANLKIQYTNNDSVTLTNWFNYTTGNRIDKIVDMTGTETRMLGGSKTAANDTFTANIADNRLVFDFFTTDNDTLTISDTNASGLHVAGNFKADGTLDGNGLRVLSDANYTAWKSDTTSINGGVQIVSELGSVENITSADSKTVTASELAQLQSDVTAWLTAHTDYADVASAIANAGTDSSVSTLIAIFDNFNTTAWGN